MYIFNIKTLAWEYIGTFGEAIAGKSAYQIALDNGFEGSEYLWLQSLKGAQGERGIAGRNGRSINIRGTVQSESQLPDTGQVADAFWDTDGHLYIWTESMEGAVEPTWYRSPILKGSQGERGVRGIQGEKGKDGIDGKDGQGITVMESADFATSQNFIDRGGRVTGKAFKQGIITRIELQFVNGQTQQVAANTRVLIGTIPTGFTPTTRSAHFWTHENLGNFQLKHQVTITTSGEIYWTPTTNTGYLTMSLSGCY